MNAIVDDLDSRPGSTTSLLRTVVGVTLRDQDGWIPGTALIAMLAAVDVPAGRARTAVTRVKAKGLLVPEKRGRISGYSLSPAAALMLARGDQRIYHPRFMNDGERWCLTSFSVPEQNRDLRHQLRRRLSWIGCGAVSAGLWICPGHLVEEVEEIVADLGLRGRVTTFMVNEIRGASPAPVAIARWWDLDALRALHDDFLAGHAAAIEAFHADPTPRSAFRTWIVALDAWRPIPYLDPGLPESLLPTDWPGRRSVPLFVQLRDSVQEPAAEFVNTVVCASVADYEPNATPAMGSS